MVLIRGRRFPPLWLLHPFRNRWMFRDADSLIEVLMSRAAFWVAVVVAAGAITVLVVNKVLAHFNPKPECHWFDKRHNLGKDDDGKLCRR